MFMKELDKRLIEAATVGDLPEIRSLIERGLIFMSMKGNLSELPLNMAAWKWSSI